MLEKWKRKSTSALHLPRLLECYADHREVVHEQRLQSFGNQQIVIVELVFQVELTLPGIGNEHVQEQFCPRILNMLSVKGLLCPKD